MNKMTDYAVNKYDKPDKDLLLNPKFQVLLRVSLQWADRIDTSDKEAIKKAKNIILTIDTEEPK